MKLSMEKAETLENFYKTSLNDLRQLRSTKQEEWRDIFEFTAEKLKTAKEGIYEMVENFFREVEEKLFRQYLSPSKACVLERVDLPIKVELNRKWRRKSGN